MGDKSGMDAALEAKVLDATLEAVSSKLLELKGQISELLMRLDTETDKVDRNTVLTNYTLITSQLSSMMQLLRRDNIPPLRNYSLFPFKLMPDVDTELEHMTEGRLRNFSHEVAPDYLRTKSEPDIEQAENQIETRVSQLQPDTLQRQVTTLNKMVSTVCDQVEKCKMQIESDSSEKQLALTHSTDDTHTLMAAINFGVNLKPPDHLSSPLQATGGTPQQPSPAATPSTTPTAGNTGQQTNTTTANKPAPPMVKTSIKSGLPPQFGR